MPKFRFPASLTGFLSAIRGRSDAKIVAGGVYASPDGEGAYSISKVLVVDDEIVHLRSYEETFETIPVSVDTAKLDVSIGHAPIDLEGFLSEGPKLINVEKVEESELEGYRLYLDAMRDLS